ncbi:MAG: pilus assembly protein PilZ [Desulfobacter postgatei]|uniref:Pilus assembly protein PilZ n=1 Tax=Desulfobacter postgatei TaxID=2293 RepID=A0A2G6MQ67_9BACT|nr:MAG: pilus assembly protein PilZ [Desulfobacter postgatei]
MVGRKRSIERRKNKRYKAVEGAYAAISPNSNKIGQIIDISMGGLCFKYINTENNSEAPVNRNEESIFLSSMGYYVGDLPFQTIADYEIKDAPSFSSMKVRRRHVKFTDLSFKQLFDLDYYMKNNVSEQLKPIPNQTKS